MERREAREKESGGDDIGMSVAAELRCESLVSLSGTIRTRVKVDLDWFGIMLTLNVVYMYFCSTRFIFSLRCFLLTNFMLEMMISERFLRRSLSLQTRSWKSTGTMTSMATAPFLCMIARDLSMWCSC